MPENPGTSVIPNTIPSNKEEETGVIVEEVGVFPDESGLLAVFL